MGDGAEPSGPTDAEFEAAQRQIDAWQELIREFEKLTNARDGAKEDATIDLRVGVDFACAAGLRRKTFTGHDVSPKPPREALQDVARCLAEWHAAVDAHQPAIDAQLAKFDAMREDLHTAHSVVDAWLKHRES